jgi:hypothetical protein
VYQIESRLRDMEAQPPASSPPPRANESGKGAHPANQPDQTSEGARKK